MKTARASVGLLAILAFLCVLPVFSSSQTQTEVTDTTPSCSEQTSLTLILQGNDTEASFRCPATWTLKPQDVTKVCRESECTNADDTLESFVPGATLTHDSAKSVYTLALPTDRQDKTFYYNCAEPASNAHAAKGTGRGGSNKTCKITVKVLASEGKQTVTCAAGETHVATVSAIGNAVTLTCPESSTLKPEDVLQVFDDRDGRCASAVALTSLVDGALSAATPATQAKTASSQYVFSVNQLPEETQQLCYKCVTPANDRKKDASTECMLKLTVKSGAAALATASISVGVLASLASFLSAN
ncbi:SRS domain-containing protein [Neospora caninum Liverpool]|uniref:SRS domain-containing protein n=1 Tax=Neospora caninum (strain Liverpool) TaxID=572307 RepID=F0VDK2_NEOCL|nr:SRS domain-containing protein [Neospora caninum Liverpool]CBZ51795.1 SRS domain-containing protein [Neospora caninum Liverpool]CEL65754.1 TPA: SRS domain-containing protein [Neospora caninum Liverpool]|eukprot:XP_003881828.1 SRS domain-containing protein [Neospora caninum Liverpool]